MTCSEWVSQGGSLIAIVPLATNQLVAHPLTGFPLLQAHYLNWLHPDRLSAHPDGTTNNLICASLPVLTSICSMMYFILYLIQLLQDSLPINQKLDFVPTGKL